MQSVREPVPIEAVRDFWDARPCNVRHGTAPVGTLEWSKQVTKRKYFVEPHIHGFAQFIRWSGKNVLEIGCGIGTDTIEFLKAGAKVTAIDLSEESLNLLYQRVQVEGLWPVGTQRKLRLFCQNAEDNIPYGKYDLAYAFGVLHHTPDPFAVLWNISNVLNHGGELRVMLYARWSLKNILFEQPEAQAGCPIARVYSMKSATALIERAGFKVTSITKTHIFPWRIKEYVKHQYVKRLPYRILTKKMFQRLEHLLGWHLLIVARKS